MRRKLDAVEHEASSSSCPIFIRQKKINRLVAYHDISPSDAGALLDRDDNPPGGWSRPRLGVPLPTLHDFLHLNTSNTLNKTNFAGSVKKNIPGRAQNKRLNTFGSLPPSSGPSSYHPSVSSSSSSMFNPSTFSSSSRVVSRKADNNVSFHSGSCSKSSTSELVDFNKQMDLNSKSASSKHTYLLDSNSDPVVISNSPSTQSFRTSLYSTLNPSPDILNTWISECQNKFSSIKSLQQYVLIKMGHILLKSAMRT